MSVTRSAPERGVFSPKATGQSRCAGTWRSCFAPLCALTVTAWSLLACDDRASAAELAARRAEAEESTKDEAATLATKLDATRSWLTDQRQLLAAAAARIPHETLDSWKPIPCTSSNLPTIESRWLERAYVLTESALRYYLQAPPPKLDVGVPPWTQEMSFGAERGLDDALRLLTAYPDADALQQKYVDGDALARTVINNKFAAIDRNAQMYPRPADHVLVYKPLLAAAGKLSDAPPRENPRTREKTYAFQAGGALGVLYVINPKEGVVCSFSAQASHSDTIHGEGLNENLARNLTRDIEAKLGRPLFRAP